MCTCVFTFFLLCDHLIIQSCNPSFAFVCLSFRYHHLHHVSMRKKGNQNKAVTQLNFQYDYIKDHIYKDYVLYLVKFPVDSLILNSSSFLSSPTTNHRHARRGQKQNQEEKELLSMVKSRLFFYKLSVKNKALLYYLTFLHLAN